MSKEELKYTKTHEWIAIEEDVGTIGLTDFAIAELNDIVFLELPDVGKEVNQKEPFGVIESVKAVFDLNSPVSGKVVEINNDLVDNLEKLISDPFNDGWMIKVELSNLDELTDLLDYQNYKVFCGEKGSH